MSQAGPTHRPVAGADLSPLMYALSAQFHQPIKLERKKGLEFIPKLGSAIDAREVSLEEKKWTLSQPMGATPISQLAVSIAESEIHVEGILPNYGAEMFEHRSGVIFNEFYKFFKPDVLLSSSALFRATMQIDGDARVFLAKEVTRFDGKRLKHLGRPIHLFGMRLFMPPFEVQQRAAPKGVKGVKGVKGAKGAKGVRRKRPGRGPELSSDWMVDIKAESMIDDTSKLFLEANAQWQSSEPWGATTAQKIVDRLGDVTGFVTSNLLPFLASNSD